MNSQKSEVVQGELGDLAFQMLTQLLGACQVLWDICSTIFTPIPIRPVSTFFNLISLDVYLDEATRIMSKVNNP